MIPVTERKTQMKYGLTSIRYSMGRKDMKGLRSLSARVIYIKRHLLLLNFNAHKF